MTAVEKLAELELNDRGWFHVACETCQGTGFKDTHPVGKFPTSCKACDCGYVWKKDSLSVPEINLPPPLQVKNGDYQPAPPAPTFPPPERVSEGGWLNGEKL